MFEDTCTDVSYIHMYKHTRIRAYTVGKCFRAPTWSARIWSIIKLGVTVLAMVCMYVCVCMYLCMCKYVYMHVVKVGVTVIAMVCIYVFVCMYVCMYVCVNMCICM